MAQPHHRDRLDGGDLLWRGLLLRDERSSCCCDAGFVGSDGSLKAGAYGALSAALFYGAGSAADNWFKGTDDAIWGDAGLGLGRATLHAGAGCVQGAVMGSGCGSGAASAFFAEGVGGKLQTGEFTADLAIRTVIGGTSSVIAGGKFGDGAVTAAFAYTFNEGLHELQNNNRYSSADELSKALGKDGVTFGKRPLEHSGGVMIGEEGGYLDRHNEQLAHEQAFYKQDGKLENIGFFPKGVGPDPQFPRNISEYRFGPIYHGISITDSMLHPPGFSASTYSFIVNNCQDYAEATRRNMGVVK